MEEIKTKYRDVEITHADYPDAEYWEVKDSEYGSYRNTVLKQVKDWINIQIAKQFKKYDVIVVGKGTVFLGTVFREDVYCVYVTRKDGGKGRYKKERVKKKTEENIQLFYEYEKLEKEEKILLNKQIKIMKEIFKIDD